MKVVILVPRREGFPDRDRIWAWVKEWWTTRHPDWPIFEGHHEAHEGLFNRSAAVNRAAAKAGDDWDVAVIIDADAICDVERTRRAVAMAHETGRMVLPYDIRKDLNAKGSEQVMAGYEGSWERWVENNYRNQVSTVLAVPRSLWLAVEGFDEKFVGWGGEDNAFAYACDTFGGPHMVIKGDVWELKHEAAPEARRGSPSHTANYQRVRRYRDAAGNPEAMRRLRGHVAPSDASPGIPKILHRTVPASTTREVERWWVAFAKLHPDWELMTHRDPLTPAEWPLTSAKWAACSSGAQLADLIRLEALLRWGGVYVDSDCEPWRSLDPLLPLSAFAAWEDERTVPNAVLGAVPNHPAIRACLDLALKRIPGEVWPAGPGVTTAILPGRSDVLLLPPGSFYAIHYRDKDRDRKMNDRATRQQNPWAFLLHRYAGSWLSKAG